MKFMPAIGRLKSELGLKITVHTGLVDEGLADELAKAEIDVAMMDIIGSEETIGSVYHLSASPSDFKNTLEMLVRRGKGSRGAVRQGEITAPIHPPSCSNVQSPWEGIRTTWSN